MGVNWAAGLIRWRPHTGSDGKTYSLAHLHPFRFTYDLGSVGRYSARTITINVGFSLHVFTCEFGNAWAPPGHEYRVFFAVRPDRTNADTVTLIVQSAYYGRIELSPRGQRAKHVRFPVILVNILAGKPLRVPP